VLIGAPGPLPFQALFGGAPPRAGKAFVFEPGANGAWSERGQLTIAGEEPAGLGAGVLLLGDEALVGAPLTGQFAGAAVRFARSADGRWAESGRIAPSQPVQGSGFGLTLAGAGTDLLVGAPMMGGTGGAFAFRRDGSGEWSQTQSITGPAQFAFMGSAIAMGEGVAVLGAPGADFFEGTGLVYRKQGNEWREAGTVIPQVTGLEAITGGTRECQDGKVASFSCSEVDLVSFLPVSALGGKRGMIVNDMWGWTDPESNREYAIVGRADGTVFIDLADPVNPVYLGELPMHAGSTANLWRDMKVYQNHVFIVADGAGAHGVQVFDLTQLRDVKNPPAKFTETAHYDRIHSAHNIVMNEETGFAYVVGASMGGETCGGGLHMIDVREPKNPKFAGCFSDTRTGNARTGYSHDAQCIKYNGPDQEFVGREICFGANETALSIADVTEKANPKPIATAAYPNVAYLHQGWVSDDHRFLYMNDEGDELAGSAPRTRTLIWDISDLEDPILVKEYLGETAATDHNLYVKGNYVYESNYVSGLRILDISDPANPVEAGYFDTVPWGEDKPGFAGAWTNYPYFASGIVVVTSMREGVFVVRYKGRRTIS
jgi:choice-of-anchor B domain-containing protein